MENGVIKHEAKPSEREKENSISQLHEILHMYPGNGNASYATNSTRQRYVFHELQPLFEAAIEKLTFPKEGQHHIRIADLGCATGFNTIFHMDFVVRTLRNLYNGRTMPQFQAFFSDLPSNDFNGLFNLLMDGSNQPYFIAGVPGSFYHVLFPTSTIHVCFSIMALHWISQVPEAILHKDSPYYNRGRVWINRGREEVADIYSKQSQRDLLTFMKCRAEEMAAGGIMFLCLMGRPDSSNPAQQVSMGAEFCGQDFEDAWDDLVKEGIISLDLRDSFNLPWYFPNATELREAVEKSGSFDIERMEVCEGVPYMSEEEFEEWIKDPAVFAENKVNLIKSILGSLVEAHIGIKSADALFKRFHQRAEALLRTCPPSRFVICTVASLVRK